MRILRHIPALLLVLVLSTMASCKNGGEVAASPKGPEVRFPIGIGGKVVEMQLAVRSLEMQQGLMNRPFLGENEGMAFIYDRPARMSFWMRNTLIPLDIGFFDREGVLREVRAMHPLDESPVESSSDSILIAVEMNQGWYREHAIKPGAKLDLQALRAALKARGFDPARFELR